MASHGSDTPTSPRAILHHTDTILCTFMHTTVISVLQITKELIGNLFMDEQTNKQFYMICHMNTSQK